MLRLSDDVAPKLKDRLVDANEAIPADQEEAHIDQSGAPAPLGPPRAPQPVERTLPTSGILAAAAPSLGSGQQRLETPHLEVSYRAPRKSLFAQE